MFRKCNYFYICLNSSILLSIMLILKLLVNYSKSWLHYTTMIFFYQDVAQQPLICTIHFIWGVFLNDIICKLKLTSFSKKNMKSSYIQSSMANCYYYDSIAINTFQLKPIVDDRLSPALSFSSILILLGKYLKEIYWEQWL